jgi:hypothetical protein
MVGYTQNYLNLTLYQTQRRNVMQTAVTFQDEQSVNEREELINNLEASNKPGARVVARIIRKADAEDAEVVMWSQNWNAHSRSS